jgi:hypothetical protein
MAVSLVMGYNLVLIRPLEAYFFKQQTTARYIQLEV